MKAFGYLLIIAIGVAAWCPWFEETEARQHIATAVRETQAVLRNGCVLTIDQQSIQKMPFGYTQTVAYKCAVDGDLITEGSNTVFVTFFKEVLNIPRPLFK